MASRSQISDRLRTHLETAEYVPISPFADACRVVGGAP
jgi:hypothetical protein